MQVTSKNIGLLPDGRYTIETNLQVRVTKSKASFIFRYQFAGRRRDLSLGSHPTVTVTAAKQEAAKCRALLARGIDPLDVRAEHRAEHARRALDFASYAELALETIFELKHLSEATKVSWRGPMKNHILPVLRHKLVADITVQDICEVLDPLWEKKTTIASRIRGQQEVLQTSKMERFFSQIGTGVTGSSLWLHSKEGSGLKTRGWLKSAEPVGRS